MSDKKFSASIPRKMYWSNEVGNYESCPDCGGKLESEHHSYLLACRINNETLSINVGNDSGYFCENCPVVVLNYEAFVELISLATKTNSKSVFGALGIIDLEAVPENKRNIPFNDSTNPIPLVPFLNVAPKKSSDQKPRKKRSKLFDRRNSKKN